MQTTRSLKLEEEAQIALETNRSLANCEAWLLVAEAQDTPPLTAIFIISHVLRVMLSWIKWENRRAS